MDGYGGIGTTLLGLSLSLSLSLSVARWLFSCSSLLIGCFVLWCVQSHVRVGFVITGRMEEGQK